MSFNKMFIMGTIGREPQLKFNEKGDPLCYLAVSTNETIKEQKITTWYQVILFGYQAEQAKKSLTKGSNIYVEGRLRPQQIKDKQGEPHTVLEISGTAFRCLDTL
jgi:single-strand DNA-binding protein